MPDLLLELFSEFFTPPPCGEGSGVGVWSP